MIKKLITKKLAALLAAFLLLAACTQSEPEVLAANDDDNGELVEIRPTISIADMEATANTRSIADNGLVDEMEAIEFAVASYDRYKSESVSTATRPAGAGQQAITFANKWHYPTDGSDISFYAMYPKSSSVDSWKTYIWHSSKPCTDVMIATATGSKNNPIQNIEFKHILTQLQFYPYAPHDEVAAQWGKITKITLKKIAEDQPIEIRFDYREDPKFHFTNDAGAPSSRDFYVPGIDATNGVDIVKGSKENAKIVGFPYMGAPITNENYVLNIDIETKRADGTTKTTSISRKGALLANTPYRFYLKFTGQGVEVEVAVSSVWQWVSGADQTASAGKTYPYVENGNMIVTSDMPVLNGQYASGTHEPWLNNDMPLTTDYNAWNYCSKKFEVAKTDGTNTWNNEWGNHTVCPAPWRMPNLYEAWVMRAMRHQLVGVDYLNTTILTASIVEYEQKKAWYIYADDTSYGGQQRLDRNSNTTIRCIRDLSPYGIYPFVAAGKYIVTKDAGGKFAENWPIHPKWEQTPAHLDQDPILHGVSSVFEVQQNDYAAKEAWNNTNNGCVAPWRRPTIRELTYMFRNKDKLTGVTAFKTAPGEASYWSSTEVGETVGTGDTVFSLDFSAPTNQVYFAKKNSNCYVRCIRDIE